MSPVTNTPESLLPGSYPRQPDEDSQVRVKLIQDTTPTRFRGNRELDISKWDDEAENRLRSPIRTSGDFCDCFSACRRSPHPRFTSLRSSPSNFPNFSSKPIGVIWFVRDACGIVCLVITWLLILYAEFVVCFVILIRAPSTVYCWFSGITFHCFAFLALISHFKCFSTDPVSTDFLENYSPVMLWWIN